MYLNVTNKSIHNDIYYSKQIQKHIEYCGCMMIKMVQWILPKYNLIHGDTILYKTLSNLYDNCIEHSLNHTEYIYLNEFKSDINDEYKIIRLIGSGSIGQVYEVKHKINGQHFALKVLHPNITIQFHIFYYFINIILFFIDYKRYLPIDNINKFMRSLYEQVNLNNECKNMNIFKNMYNECDIINIPTHYKSSSNILIMDYLPGCMHNSEQYKLYGIYKISKLIMYLSIFSLNSALNNKLHGDLHIGNWSINTRTNTINIYDFGYCYNISKEEFSIIEKLINNPFSIESLDMFLHYYINKEYNSKLKNEYIYERYKEEIHTLFTELNVIQVQEIISNLFKFCLKYNILLSNACLNSILVFLQLISIYEKTGFLENRSKQTKINSTLINICKTYNICPLLKAYLEEDLDNTLVLGNFNTLNKYNNLKKYI
tara:strand:- start:358 stop:1644 length:1287 start_codon:yes stop_codon:yes gene_type:complete